MIALWCVADIRKWRRASIETTSYSGVRQKMPHACHSFGSRSKTDGGKRKGVFAIRVLPKRRERVAGPIDALVVGLQNVTT
jgi:hypothetical protein